MSDFKAKNKFNFGCGSAVCPARGAYSPQIPSWISVVLLLRRGREVKEREGKGKRRERERSQ